MALRILVPSVSGGAELAGSVDVSAILQIPPILGGVMASGSFKEAAQIFNETGTGGMIAGGFATKGMTKDVKPGIYCVSQFNRRLRITRKCHKRESNAYVSYGVIRQLMRDGRIGRNGFIWCPDCA